jgi:hypothetical protein
LVDGAVVAGGMVVVADGKVGATVVASGTVAVVGAATLGVVVVDEDESVVGSDSLGAPAVLRWITRGFVWCVSTTATTADTTTPAKNAMTIGWLGLPCFARCVLPSGFPIDRLLTRDLC